MPAFGLNRTHGHGNDDGGGMVFEYGAKVAAQEKDKRWRTFTRLAMQPGDSIVAYACKGTGKHMNWAKAAGDNSVTFPTDEEINKAYGN